MVYACYIAAALSEITDEPREKLEEASPEIRAKLDATISHMARFDDKPVGDRAQTCINRGVPGLFRTSYLSL